MKNISLAKDYIIRAKKRLKAVDVLLKEESWSDVVRESQEVVELALKSLLRASSIEVPRIHDVSPVLEENKARLPKKIQDSLTKIVNISRQLRRDRELAFYGSEDLTPSLFYKKEDATVAFKNAEWIVNAVIG
ncbi:MAG: HEPN domain-containing protein, partial [Deltaproteobacteria bacterium]